MGSFFNRLKNVHTISGVTTPIAALFRRWQVSSKYRHGAEDVSTKEAVRAVRSLTLESMIGGDRGTAASADSAKGHGTGLYLNA